MAAECMCLFNLPLSRCLMKLMIVEMSLMTMLICSGVLGQTTSRRQSRPARRGVEEESQTEDGFVSVNTTNLTEIRIKFPGYFKTPMEQEALIMANPNPPQRVLNESSVFRRCFTNGYCERISKVEFDNPTTTEAAVGIGSPNGRRRKRQVSNSPECLLDVYDEDDLTFHGCCISFSNLEDPPTLPTAEPGQSGDTTIVQFPGLKQYFEIQYCCQAQDCSGCQCAQTYYVTSAVVSKVVGRAVRFGTEYVRVPGCCKCLNTILENGDN